MGRILTGVYLMISVCFPFQSELSLLSPLPSPSSGSSRADSGAAPLFPFPFPSASVHPPPRYHPAMAPTGRLLAVAALSVLCEYLVPHTDLPHLLILSPSPAPTYFIPRCLFKPPLTTAAPVDSCSSVRSPVPLLRIAF
jgi:hypothetical protein